jgi:uncharacterized protein involved in exopolysaccharide biosynthesis/Mrp family chromosome partitioning ATPase
MQHIKSWAPVGDVRPRVEMGAEARHIGIREIRIFVRRYLWTILAPLAVCIGLAVAYLATATPMYVARAQLVIDQSTPLLLPGMESGTLVSLDTAQVESQLVVLRSERIAAMVVEKLDLENNPDFVAVPSLLSLARSWISDAAEEPDGMDRARRTIELFLNGLNVRRSGLSYAIDVAFTSRDAQLAADIANATAEAFIEDQIEARSHAARVGGGWQQQRLQDLRTQMNLASRAVQEFRASHNYRIADGDGAAADDGNTLEELEAAAETYRRIYESFLQGFTETVQRESFPMSDARIVTPATPPLGRSEPRTKLVLALWAMVGAMAGLGAAIMRHNLDPSIRTDRQVREEAGLDCLGVFPRLKPLSYLALRRRERGARTAALGGEGRARPGHQILIEDKPSPSEEDASDTETPATPPPPSRWQAFLASLRPRRTRWDHMFDEVTERDSAFVRSLRGLRALIAVAAKTNRVRCIGVTSASVGEGKSTLASNLGTLFAMAGARVIVVDADLSERRLSDSVVPGAKSGLLEVLCGTANLMETIVPSGRAPVDVLPAAGRVSLFDESDMLTSEAMSQVLRELSLAYDVVIFDLPSLATAPGSPALGSLLDGVVVVAVWGKTTVEALRGAATWLALAQVRILGAVIVQNER